MKRIWMIMAAVCLMLLTGCAQENMSIGVIGGSDGPTQIMIVAAPFWWAPFAIIAAVIAAVVIAIVRIRRKKKERE